MAHRSLRNILLIAALVYLLVPWDLIPDFMGVVGRIDDVIIISYCLYRYYLVQKERKNVHEERSTEERRAAGAAATAADPYEILGISREASAEEIKAAFKREAAKYHPDKVSHLGPELQRLAHERMLAIRNAYECLRSTTN